MKKKRIPAPLSELIPNDGRLGWLPNNPRQWTKDDIRKTKESLKRDPDFLEDRPALLVPCEDGYIIFAGNLRYRAAKELKMKTIPAVVYEPETDEDRETIKRRSILDNGSFGSWDYDLLANEWDDLPLTDWGVPAWDATPDPETVTDAETAQDAYRLEVSSEDGGELVELEKELTERGFSCRVH